MEVYFDCCSGWLRGYYVARGALCLCRNSFSFVGLGGANLEASWLWSFPATVYVAKEEQRQVMDLPRPVICVLLWPIISEWED